MEKLRDKIFYTVFFIVSIFIILIVLFFNFQIYHKEYNGIKDNLIRMEELLSNIEKSNNIKPSNDKELPSNDLKKRIIMDYNFYTILLDKDNNIIDRISHNENGLNDNIMEVAEDIVDDNEDKDSEIKIRGLYFSEVAYNFNSGNFLIIVDTSFIQNRLLSVLSLSIILLGLALLLIYYFSKKITEWIIKPVEDSFNKQKEFVANASHELKTPLSVIMASVDCLEVDKKNEKWLNNLRVESDRMNNLITRLLDLSKLENMEDKSTYILNDLSKIALKRTLIFEGLAFENKVEIESNIEKEIMLKCNQVEIDELVGIIIDNAIKHSFVNSKIRVNLYRKKNNIILDVINEGEPIIEDECDKIFERFYRSDKSRNRSANRYGLGLAIAKNIVSNHDGEIKAFSENGETTFRVIFKSKEH